MRNTGLNKLGLEEILPGLRKLAGEGGVGEVGLGCKRSRTEGLELGIGLTLNKRGLLLRVKCE